MTVRINNPKSAQCLFCTSVKCSYAIYTVDLTFCELACFNHHEDLAIWADEKIIGTRCHLSGTGHYTRAKIRSKLTSKVLTFFAGMLAEDRVLNSMFWNYEHKG